MPFQYINDELKKYTASKPELRQFQRPLNLLAAGLESIYYLEQTLSKPALSLADNFLFAMSYQFLGNALQKLPFRFSQQHPELSKTIFAEEVGGNGKPWIDRLAFAHHHKLSEMLGSFELLNDPRLKQELLLEAQSLKKIIIATFNTFPLPKWLQMYEQQALMPVKEDPQFIIDIHHLINEFTNTPAEVEKILFIIDYYFDPSDSFSEDSIHKTAFALCLSQLLGNNIKQLRNSGIALNSSNALIRNRNMIAHTNSFSTLGIFSPHNSNIRLGNNFLHACFTLQGAPDFQGLLKSHQPSAHAAASAALAASPSMIISSPITDKPLTLSDESLNKNRLQAFTLGRKKHLLDNYRLKSASNQKMLADLELALLLFLSIQEKNENAFFEITNNIKDYTKTPLRRIINLGITAHLKGKMKGNVQLPDGKKAWTYGTEATDVVSSIEIAYVMKAHIKSPPEMCENYLLSLCTMWPDQERFFEALLHFGANPNVTSISNEGNFQPILFNALSKDNTNQTTYLTANLLAHGADPDLRNDNGDTPLSFAALKSYSKELFIELLEYRADPCAPCNIVSTSAIIESSSFGVIALDNLADNDTLQLLKLMMAYQMLNHGMQKAFELADTTYTTSQVKSCKKTLLLTSLANSDKHNTTAFLLYLSSLKAFQTDKNYILYHLVALNNAELLQQFMDNQSIEDLMRDFNQTLAIQIPVQIEGVQILNSQMLEAASAPASASKQALKLSKNLLKTPQHKEDMKSNQTATAKFLEKMQGRTIGIMDFAKVVGNNAISLLLLQTQLAYKKTLKNFLPENIEMDRPKAASIVLDYLFSQDDNAAAGPAQQESTILKIAYKKRR